MKNMKKIAAVLMCMLITTMLLAGCGGDKYKDSAYLGTWTATTVTYSGMSIAPEDALGGEMSFNLEASGRCTLNVAGDETSGRWSETDNGFSVADEFDVTVDGDLGTMEYEGMTIEFQR